MVKNKKTIEIQNNLLSKVYDLILNPEICEDECSKLIQFKNAIGNGKDFEEELMHLAEGLRQLALYKFKYKKTLSTEVGKFYMDISTTGLLEKNFAIGLASVALWFNHN